MFWNSAPSTTTPDTEVVTTKTTACDLEKLTQIKPSVANFLANSPPFNDTIGGSYMLHPAFECLISQDIGYTVFSTVGAFYLPLAFISAVYLNVYRVARSRIHRKQFNLRKQRYQRAGDDDRPSGRTGDMSSVIEPEKESNLLRVFGGLRARLSASSVITVQPTTTSGMEFAMSPMTNRRAASFNNGSFGRHRQTTNSRPSSSADRGSGTTGTNHLLQPLVPSCVASSQPTQQPQLVVAQSTSRQYLSVNASPRLSESSSPPSTPSSSRGGSWIYLTREYFLDVLSRRSPNPTAVDADPSELRRYRERRARGRRERKAARTLAVITGTFIVCWLPFFVVATVRPFCGDHCRSAMPREALSVISWLGYGNSLVNPLIYTVFNPDFRRAFRRLLRLERGPAASGFGGVGGGLGAVGVRGVGLAGGRQPVDSGQGRSTRGGDGFLRPDGFTHIDVRSSAVTV